MVLCKSKSSGFGSNKGTWLTDVLFSPAVCLLAGLGIDWCCWTDRWAVKHSTRHWSGFLQRSPTDANGSCILSERLNLPRNIFSLWLFSSTHDVQLLLNLLLLIRKKKKHFIVSITSHMRESCADIKELGCPDQKPDRSLTWDLQDDWSASQAPSANVWVNALLAQWDQVPAVGFQTVEWGFAGTFGWRSGTEILLV